MDAVYCVVGDFVFVQAAKVYSIFSVVPEKHHVMHDNRIAKDEFFIDYIFEHLFQILFKTRTI